MKKRYGTLFLGMLFILPSAQAAEGRHAVELYLGHSINKDYDLTIKLDDGRRISLKSEYDTKPFSFPPFYALRYGYWQNNTAWEIEHIHHKIYLEDLAEEPLVQKFQITDGYNLFSINRAWDIDDTIYRLGLGTVVSHPDAVVDGIKTYVDGGEGLPKIWADGYHWSGYNVLAGIQKRFFRSDNSYFTVEAKAIHSWTKVPLENGSVEVPNTSLQLMFGYGGFL
jgi:hypothetical protein